jgi:IS4 transposase
MFSITTFHELLKGLPRATFDKLVQARQADKYSKGFGHWDHLMAMLYAQLTEAPGLRALEAGFNSHASHHYHLGTDCIKRSTLAEANQRRSDAVFNDVVVWLMGQVSSQVRSDSSELMYLLDSTSVTLKGREFDQWTLENRNRNTQGIKVHVLLDAQTQTPQWQCFSAANINDIEMASEVPLRAGALYVFDKGYCNYRWWHKIETAGARFVTRFKRNASLTLLEEREVPGDAKDIVISDEIVELKNRNPGGNRKNPYIAPLRRVTVVRPDKDTPIVLATNDLTSPALVIAQRYKDRWGIELFFKWIKQHLKIKKFLGRSENAVRIQILTALISYLLLALYKHRNAFAGSLWDCLAVVRATLFQRIATENYYRERRRQQQATADRQLSLI